MEQQYVEVVGVGAAEAPCDRVRVHLGAAARADSVGDAFTQANLAMERMLSSLREHGIDEFQTSELEIFPDHDDKGRPQGYRTAVGTRVTLPDVASAGPVLAAAVEAGGDASRLHGLQLGSSSTDEAQEAARAAAWADAVTKAEHHVALSGRSLGQVLVISERGRDDGPSPRFALAAATAGDVEGGSQTVRCTLTVRWALD